jgi:phage host-nuclease inhibitor protein Gam
MSEQEDRLKNLREHVKDAHDELNALDSEELKAHASALKRLEGVIAYAAVVLETTDPDLVSTNTGQTIQNAAVNIANQAITALQDPETYGGALLDAIALLPVAKGRDVEQQVKDAAANFQRSASQRLNSVESQASDARAELERLSQEIGERSSAAKTEIDAQVGQLETKLTELEQTITNQRVALDEQMTNQGKAFTDTQEERAAEFQTSLEAFRNELARTQRDANEEVETRVSEIRRMEEESARLVGAIGLAGTAERYSEEAATQKEAAGRYRLLTIVFALGAVATAIVASIKENQDTESLVAKLAVSLILGGLAAYTARQSGRHRAREEHARGLQLELTAFSPFIEPLSPEQQEEERVIMARKTFGKTTAPGKSEEEPGPTAISFLLQRRQKELETDDQ